MTSPDQALRIVKVVRDKGPCAVYLPPLSRIEICPVGSERHADLESRPGSAQYLIGVYDARVTADQIRDDLL